MIEGIGRDRGNRLRSRLHPLPIYAHLQPGLPISPRGWRCLTRDQVVGERYGIRRRIVRQVQSRGHNHTSVLARFRVVLGAWTAFLRSCRARSRLLCASRKSGMLWEYRVRVKDVRWQPPVTTTRSSARDTVSQCPIGPIPRPLFLIRLQRDGILPAPCPLRVIVRLHDPAFHLTLESSRMDDEPHTRE